MARLEVAPSIVLGEQVFAGELASAARDAFVEASVGLRRLALCVVEVARDDLRRVAVWISLALHAMVLFLPHRHAIGATRLKDDPRRRRRPRRRTSCGTSR